MKYRLEGTTIEAIDTYVRITLGNGKIEVTKRQLPSSQEIADMLHRMQGYPLNAAQLQACSRASDDAKNNKLDLAI